MSRTADHSIASEACCDVSGLAIPLLALLLNCYLPPRPMGSSKNVQLHNSHTESLVVYALRGRKMHMFKLRISRFRSEALQPWRTSSVPRRRVHAGIVLVGFVVASGLAMAC